MYCFYLVMSSLTEEQRRKIEENRLKALQKRAAILQSRNQLTPTDPKVGPSSTSFYGSTPSVSTSTQNGKQPNSVPFCQSTTGPSSNGRKPNEFAPIFQSLTFQSQKDSQPPQKQVQGKKGKPNLANN